MNQLLVAINKLLYPYILGYWSENNGGGVVVTNASCTQMRGIGSRKWTTFVEAPINLYNTHLEPAIEDHVDGAVFIDFLINEKIEDLGRAQTLVELCKPYFLARRGDLQAQYHYCLMKSDPMESAGEQQISFIFQGTQFDMYDMVPEMETTNQYSAFVGGSLGWLAHLNPFSQTLKGIAAAKKRLV